MLESDWPLLAQILKLDLIKLTQKKLKRNDNQIKIFKKKNNTQFYL